MTLGRTRGWKPHADVCLVAVGGVGRNRHCCVARLNPQGKAIQHVDATVTNVSTLGFRDGSAFFNFITQLASNHERPTRPLISLCPQALLETLRVPQSLGFLGGRPNHAIFFIGAQGTTKSASLRLPKFFCTTKPGRC